MENIIVSNVEKDSSLPGINMIYYQQLYDSISHLKKILIRENGSESVRIFNYLYDIEKDNDCLGIYLQDISHKEFIWKLAFFYSCFLGDKWFEVLEVPNYGIVDLGTYSIVFFPALSFREGL
jgi:hypothetical protein